MQGILLRTGLVRQDLAGGLQVASNRNHISLVHPESVQFEIASRFHNEQAMVAIRPDPEVPGIVRVLNHDVFERDRLADPLSGFSSVVDDTGVDEGLALLAGIIVCLLAIPIDVRSSGVFGTISAG